MSIQLACNTSKPAFNDLRRHDLRRPKCPHCGSIVLIAEESAFNCRGHISHAWSCDDCAHEFVTSIPLRPF